MRILSAGLGVQSSTIFLMACEGELELDAAIMADTQWETGGTYGWAADVLGYASRAGIPFEIISRGSLRYDSLDSGHGRKASMPLYHRNADGSRGIERRQCTKEYKVEPIQRRLRELGATAKHPIELAIGISLDEYQRMRDSRVKYVKHVFPLIERRMTRGDCIAWLERHGYPIPPKSACIGCPFRRDAGWRALTPDEFADAVDFDEQIRIDPKGYWKGERFLHDSLVPLSMVDLRSEQDRGQMELFTSDGCGVLCESESA